MLGYVWIETRRETEGAAIYIDDVLVGYAPRVPYHKPFGVEPDIEHIVRLEYQGYQDHITTFSIPTIPRPGGGTYTDPGGFSITATMIKSDEPVEPVEPIDNYMSLPLYTSDEEMEVGVVYRVGTTGTKCSKLTAEQAGLVKTGEGSAIDYIQQNIDDYAAKQKTAAIPVDSGTTGKTLLLIGGLALLGLLLSKK